MLRTFFIALLLAAAPIGTSFALACQAHDAKQAMSCAEDAVWDEEKATCVKVTG